MSWSTHRSIKKTICKNLLNTRKSICSISFDISLLQCVVSYSWETHFSRHTALMLLKEFEITYEICEVRWEDFWLIINVFQEINKLWLLNYWIRCFEEEELNIYYYYLLAWYWRENWNYYKIFTEYPLRFYNHRWNNRINVIK